MSATEQRLALAEALIDDIRHVGDLPIDEWWSRIRRRFVMYDASVFALPLVEVNDEPSVQVPVALIERLPHAPLCRYDRTDALAYRGERANCDCWKSEVLSQPTPSAEQCTCPPPATHLGEGPDQDCPKHGERLHAAPPRIEDMAPGTTFRARTRDGVLSTSDRFWMVADNGWVFSTGAHHLSPDRIDPSTISDVTRPEVTS